MVNVLVIYLLPFYEVFLWALLGAFCHNFKKDVMLGEYLLMEDCYRHFCTSQEHFYK